MGLLDFDLGIPGIPVRARRTRAAKAVVTGAGSGIGRAFALELAARGGEVLCADVDIERAAQTARMIDTSYGRPAHSYLCDVARRDDMESLALHAELIFGAAPTLVINNAGVGIGGKPVGEIGLDDWQWALGINLWGVVHGCEIFAPRLRAAGRGGIINVASAAGFAAAPGMAAYNVSKAGVISLSETLAAELSGSGVAVTVLCPTFVKTNVVRDGRIAAGSSRLAAELMRRIGFSPERVARTALDASDHGRLYVLPQLDARAVWLLKRQFPSLYTHALGVLNRVLPQEESSSPVADAAKTGV
ncbi:SDR family NAD(P)-dependent oxidoreductase [Nocardia sp. NPDC051570]|uniref:SDR family NAD(P)-dependent oxidoreductase n=1 Tax=Nocardia sp. NPDC051570 TaxID=3364324 RepID=UPI00379904BA